MEQQRNERARRFDEATLQMEAFSRLGLNERLLTERGVKDDLLEGRRTQKMVPIRIKGENFTLSAEAKLQLRRSSTGEVLLRVSGMRQMPEMKSFLGYEFTKSDKEQLLSTGHLGHVASFRMRDGESEEGFLSFDRDTNELMVFDCKSLRLPDEIGGVRLTDEMKNNLREGKSIHLQGVRTRTGEKVDCEAMVSALRRGLEMRFLTQRESFRKVLGVTLDDGERDKLLSGEPIYIKDMLSHKGARFSAWVKKSEDGTHLEYFQQNPKKSESENVKQENPVEEKKEVDSKKKTTEGKAQSRPIPKSIGGVILSQEEQAILLKGDKVFLRDMQDMHGERFSANVSIAENGRILYESLEEKVPLPNVILGVRLKKEEKDLLEEGGCVFLEGLRTGGGEKENLYVRRDDKFPDRILFFENDPEMNFNEAVHMIGKIEPRKKVEKQETEKIEEPLKKGGMKI
ncbi:MAG: DUF3945 domain-containing protein [Alistipes sp.]|nr:DUF3945 domain-containing protein [Candidatus Alistipes equi]